MRSEQELRRKIGQLMVCGFTGKSVTPEIRSLIEQEAVGGIILFARNMGKAEDVLRLNTELQLVAKRAGHERPLLI